MGRPSPPAAGAVLTRPKAHGAPRARVARERSVRIPRQAEHRFQWLAGDEFIKSRYYQRLYLTHGRTVNAWERRMCNISYVLSLLG